MSMDPAEVEFLAEKTMGEIGPFSPSLPVDVPLWMALNLKQRQKCRIQPPEWMDVEALEEVKQKETDDKFFTAMPSNHYMEITQLLMKYAPEDIPRADQIRTLIKDIWDLRNAKLRSSIDVFVRSDVTHAKLNHLTPMEINTARPFLTRALDQMHMLRTNTQTGLKQTQE
ncbi:DNA replication complex GINS protein PSF2 isoform X2 [Lingula anatina]|uniref:DNA replication complex GINS protein PSF2 n=1 Tax=Lingula anatina TaxID=7574 RepID=A0A1S3HSV6_LINAN|nr:DNA replication complex GINS protein PSF2 isoform X2 [Lingula anatina]|eukprot:XP_013388139.1 DNA replication complex GINS protein PSF2 isoform X2 [Lingula anatina]